MDNKLRLKEMDASDMLDVIHYYFESDNTYSSEEQMASASKIRESVYGDLYGQDYKYKYVPKNRTNNNPRAYTSDSDFDLPVVSEEEERIKPFNPRAEAPKPFVPPTKVDSASTRPFGEVLDAPMGG